MMFLLAQVSNQHTVMEHTTKSVGADHVDEWAHKATMLTLTPKHSIHGEEGGAIMSSPTYTHIYL